MPNPSNRFHLWIYRNSPNVGSIVHTHPPYCALSVVGEPLAVAHMDHTMFHDRLRLPSGVAGCADRRRGRAR